MSTGFDRDPDEFARGAKAVVVYPDLGGSSRDADARLEETAGLALAIGIEVVERAAWIQRRNSGEWDLFDFNWWADLDPDETITPEFRTGEPWNYPGWSNKRFDELVTAAQDTLDVEKRKTYYTEACDILMDEAPIAIISHMPVFKVFSQKVKGFKYIPVDSLNLHTVSLG